MLHCQQKNVTGKTKSLASPADQPYLDIPEENEAVRDMWCRFTVVSLEPL